ncbi:MULTISPECIES: alpha/beta hydrolase [Mycolicibacterium]|uniref:Alpha/beta hydrolase fold-3 n=1 Tax=Mycolicibacterium senegalense TaxID=1796 RepID=A0A378T5N6_9MYCO|nr:MULTISPECIES: alpha/beta hydrolase [Mycolicibacterium]MCV7336000.1 alpha/beta hydrolase [Mycolicibacterium senegalense]MDR7291051.1 acetyl esterase/lipase [Mycolicibacterium senegalense]QZA22579.1 alpha/beta hydrolase [Mycolicibacterium senegalense]CDP83388.1 LipW protein [Mycolicibacterium farcinogenes]STZ55215.1 alpha/beta hydrolase fold-3 [Mycolicibacterium senegalense]
MAWLERLDPALQGFAEARTDLSTEQLGVVRTSLDQRRRDAAQALDTPGVEIVGARVALGRRTIAVRIYRGGPSPSPAVVYCHSGAFVLGNLDTDQLQCVELARRARCTVISMDYRLAPEYPYPAAFDDAMVVLNWAATLADELDIDAGRIAVAGSSAGGALAALLAQHSAAGSAPPVVFQALHQPVLDDRPTSSKEEFTDTPGFDGPATGAMWRHYAGAREVPETAVPARSATLAGVAPALITCSELDPLRDEALDYARRLLDEDVATELHLFPGTCHGFDSLLPDWEVSQQLFALQGAALRRALHG